MLLQVRELVPAGRWTVNAEKVGRELAAVLDQLDQAEAELREVVKERKEGLAALRSRARELRDHITGRRGSQTLLEAALGEARGVADRKKRGAP